MLLLQTVNLKRCSLMRTLRNLKVLPVRGEELTLVARLIPTFRLLSKSVMSEYKGDLEENDSVGVWSLDVSKGCPHHGAHCGEKEGNLCNSDQVLIRL